MKINNILVKFFSFVLLFIVIAVHAGAQNQGLQWKTWYGNIGFVSSIKYSYIDSAGNTYVYGLFGRGSKIEDDRYICPLDSVHLPNGAEGGGALSGVFIAKIDSEGQIVWLKSAECGGYESACRPWNMVVHNNQLTIGFSLYNQHRSAPQYEWLWFFDTMITDFESTPHFYRDGHAAYFVTFDMDGNILDYHDMRVFARDFYEDTTLKNIGLYAGYNKFCIDNNENIHLFASPQWCFDDSLHRAYVIIDGDSNRKCYLNIGESPLSTSFYLILDSTWNIVNYRKMIYDVDGWQPTSHFTEVMYVDITGIIVDGSDIYIGGSTSNEEGLILCYDSNYMGFTARIYFDSKHSIKLENVQSLFSLPFVMKLNSRGEIVWVQQLYSDTVLSRFIPFSNTNQIALDASNVYLQVEGRQPHHGNPGITKVYLDSAHTIEINETFSHANLGNFSFTTAYNRYSGEPVAFYLLDTVEDSWSYCIFSRGDEIIQTVGHGLPSAYSIHTCYMHRINKHTGETQKVWKGQNISAYGLSISDNGYIFRGEVGRNSIMDDSIEIHNSIYNSSVLLFYYDSTLDNRCAPVDSLWVLGTGLHTVALEWSSSTDHEQYEVAYTPVDDVWEHAHTMTAAGLSIMVTLPDDQCYQFRVRGVCNSTNNSISPWSDTVEACPQVGIVMAGDDNGWSLSPNPTTGVVTIQGADDDMESIEVMDIMGRTVATFAHVSTFDVSLLPSGNYMVKVVSLSGQTGYLKLVKK